MKNNYILIIVLSLCVVSCKTYTITTESFKEQFYGIDNASREVKVVNIAGMYNKKFSSNTLKTIIVRDKANNKIEMVNRPSLEMRVTTITNKKYIMYFDTVYLENDTLFGSKARLISLKETKIPFNEIVKVEIQDGRKKYN